MRRRAVKDDLSDVGGAIAWVDGEISEAGLSDGVRDAVQVCLEEALVNLIVHGQAPDGDKDITVAFSSDAAAATVVITDRCSPYDVTCEAPPAAPTREDMREGGMGLRLLRAFATELSYVSAEGRNVLTLKVRSSTGDGAAPGALG